MKILAAAAASFLVGCAAAPSPPTVLVEARIVDRSGALVASPRLIARSGETARIAVGDIDLAVTPTVLTKPVHGRRVSTP